MKFLVCEVREDEMVYLEQLKQRLKVELVITKDCLTMENTKLAEGAVGISILGRTRMDEEMFKALSALSVKYVSTRTVGYNHIDLKAAGKYGIKVCNARYDIGGVADFTILLMLLALRKYKPAMWRQNVNDYSLKGLIGRQMKNMTVGIVGAGRIGTAVMQELTGFGCRILYTSEFKEEKADRYGSFTDRETLYKESDIISLHLPLTQETRYLIDEASLNRMKEGVIIINTARGELMNSDALIKGIESGKIGALGMDVFEKEDGIYHEDRRNDILKNQKMVYLRQFPNVVLTQHMAFYTEEAVSSMVECGIMGLYNFAEGNAVETELTENQA